MLLSKDAIADVVEVLHGADFYRPAHQVVFDCILDLYGRGEPADAITVAAELNRTDQLSRMGGAVYLHTLIASTPTAANAATTPRSWPSRPSCAGWSRPAPAWSSWATAPPAARATSTTSSTARSRRSTTSPRSG